MKTSEENGQLLTRRFTNQLKREYKTYGRLYLVIRLILEDSHSNAEPLHCNYQCFELQVEILQLSVKMYHNLKISISRLQTVAFWVPLLRLTKFGTGWGRFSFSFSMEL